MKIFSILKSLIFISLITFSTHMSASIFTNWTEYPNDPLSFPFDPISSTLFDDYFPCTIYDEQLFSGHGDSVLYKMWYQGEDVTGKATIALSYSSDGINWTLKSATVIDDPDATVHPSHPFVLYDANGFGGGPYFYQMWYWTGHASIVTLSPPNLTLKSALSVDGVNWTTPVTNTQDTTQFLALTVSTTQPFYQFYGFGTVIYNPNATSIPGEPFTFPYAVFFDSAARQSVLFNYQEAVGLAYSSDGIHWIRYGTNPVLIPSTNTADWDGVYEYRASVLKLDVDGMYHMYFSGSNGSSVIGLSYAHGIGHAMSADGINWTKDPSNPIFIVTQGVAWRSNHILAPSVVVTANNTCSALLEMWFSGGNASNNRRIGFATLPCLSPKAPNILELTSSVNPSLVGQPVTFTATVVPTPPETFIPSGTVTFFVDGIQLGSPVTIINSQATSIATSNLSIGAHNVQAVYSGDVNYQGTQSEIVQNVVILLPPENLRGRQICIHTRHPGKMDILIQKSCESVNILNWDPPSSGETPVAYKIYRDAALTVFVAEVFAYQQLEYTDRHCKNKDGCSYYIVSVDSLGNISSPASIVIVNCNKCESHKKRHESDSSS